MEVLLASVALLWVVGCLVRILFPKSITSNNSITSFIQPLLSGIAKIVLFFPRILYEVFKLCGYILFLLWTAITGKR